MRLYFSAVSECYTKGSKEKLSIRKVADEFGITHLKARKILITTGVYSNDASNEIRELKNEGKSIIKEIMEKTALSRASVQSYLPYTKIVYNAEELSTNAERIRKYRERQQIFKKVETCMTDNPEGLSNTVWQAIIKYEGYL